MNGLSFDCSSSGSVPIGPIYNNSNYKACALAGSSPGSPIVDGRSYLDAAFGIKTSEIGINVVAVFVIWIIYCIINTIGKQFYHPSKGGFIKKIYKGGNAPKVNTAEDEENQIKLVRKAQENIGSTLTLVRSEERSLCNLFSLEEFSLGQI